MTRKFFDVLLLCIAMCVIPTSASAQTNLGNLSGFHIGPSTGEVVGILIGAGAVIGVVVYLAVPKHKTIEGCVVSGEGGLRLMNDKNKQTYALSEDGVTLLPGRRCTLKGKQGKKKSGTRDFRVTKLLKDEGSCSEHSLPSNR